ncbi:double-strand break repair helicase AddA [Thalassococcus lentus]|uniref:DNA 3'-5' helicase n=1 Tax=Thalassococcus lentus TaxID=1210524 RepID=A0ABT4XND2_9RHOB|nr:double-strand break repair helicase AddA [Thalassococcus lentus]MDA7423454.1 double-strand break repair helicase AddA [Thalassococcus lentus]
MIRDEATQAQVRAAEPGASTWLAANAGSGKTRVLTDRVARLLLDGVQPEHILCLTYTKAAATEMQNRLFKRLGAWAMLDSDALRDELRQLGADADLSDEFLQQARTLFARAIEAPGGLRIQTIHSFCAALLRRFPLEAGVSPQFTEMEDRAADLLRAEILDQIADGPQSRLVRGIAPFVVEENVDDLLRAITKHGDDFVPGRTRQEIRSAYGIQPGVDEQSLIADLFFEDTVSFVQDVAELCLAHGSANDLKFGAALKPVKGNDKPSFDALFDAITTQKNELRKKFFNKGLAEGPMAVHLPRFATLTEQVMALHQKMLALVAADRELALYEFGRVFVPAYEAAKQARGWLDFDDLITRARDLLSDSNVAEWVLYRLDGGIDHILVDEAQDTSPVQWKVIERLAQEFTAGIGARANVSRTIFVVGDKKQSIYSFQGADPNEFDRMRNEFAERLKDTNAPLQSLALKYSFRSAEPILRVVDNTFAGAQPSGFEPDQTHAAFKSEMPGRVDLWPLVDNAPRETDGDWYDPIDRLGSQHHTVILAKRVAHFVAQTIGTPIPVEIGNTGTYQTRPAHAGDFLILVRGRQRLFSEIIRACKQSEIPIAGADRLKVTAELAVQDIVALLQFLATQEDDLSLATALRSPLFGLSEQDLFDLAHRRGEAYLWEYLREQRANYAETVSVLEDLRDNTDFLRPFDLIDRILTRHSGRRRLIGRLGNEAEDGINALLGQALSYEQSDVPSLTGFLQWVQADDLQIKRAAEGAGRTLRVMTVHGAKGLEAPIVIMPDCVNVKNDIRSELLKDNEGLVWKQPGKLQPDRQIEVLEDAKTRQAQERDRLLYVGLTRAEKWLVVAGAGSPGTSGNTWYEKVQRGMDGAGAIPQKFDLGEPDLTDGLRVGNDWDHLPFVQEKIVPDTAPHLDAYLLEPAKPADPFPETKSPSDLGGAKALPGAEGDSEEVAKLRGSALHQMLELLAAIPESERQEAADALMAHQNTDIDLEPIFDLLPKIRTEALNVLSNPDLASLHGPESLAEVSISAKVAGIGRLHGIIDRLIVTPEKVTAIDYKSNRVIPDDSVKTPEGLLRQMGAYEAMLSQLYPDHQIEVGLIWTAKPVYMPLSHDLVSNALQRATTS